MAFYYIVTKNGKKYYYHDNKRITAEEGERLGAREKSKKSSKSRRKSRVPCKSHQYRAENGRCRNKSGYKHKK